CMSPRTDFGIEPDKDAGLAEHVTSGIFAEHADGLRLQNVEVVWGENRQDYWAHALEAHNVSNLRLSDFTGKAAKEDLEDQLID
ncbi:MAG: hypothetical protein ACOCZE_07510, partial [Planctomycetota bacterium]